MDNGGTLVSKLAFFYDEDGSIGETDELVQHDDINFSSTILGGRGNLSSVKRYNVTQTNVFTTTSSTYNTAGALVSSTDATGNLVKISYADSFSDGNNTRHTLAYPTKVTDPDDYYSTSKYNFDFGGVTSRQTPRPNTTDPNDTQIRPEQASTFDSIGRLQQVTNVVNNAYTRFEYSTGAIKVDTYTTIQEGLGEAHSFQFTDGAGRVIATARDHNTNTFSGQKIIYDVMGRVIKTSNPTETTASGSPFQWNTTGDDLNTGWIYIEQTYDWKGRPLVTTHPSMTSNSAETTTKQFSYSDCGCAGGQVVTITDEGTIQADGSVKKRQQKIYADVLGRTVKTEMLNWDGTGPYGTNGAVYSAIVNTYNARDQIEQSQQYAGPAGSGTFQNTTLTYDGYGRLSKKHVPQQTDGTETVFTYNNDDTISTVTDARGAVSTYTYDKRHLLTGINYSAPAGITPASNVVFAYDAASNRTSMTDGLGNTTYNYDQLSRLLSETRVFTNVGTFTLTYDYNLAGLLKKITDVSNTTINYGYDRGGRLTGVTGSDTLVGGVSNYASGFQYRAWGALKQVAIGTHTSSFSFNSVLRPTNFNISGGVVNQNYEYYGDGHLSFVHNTTDNNFDRAFFYDHAGRLTLAVSGGAARNDTGSIPMYETFSHDAFDNVIDRKY